MGDAGTNKLIDRVTWVDVKINSDGVVPMRVDCGVPIAGSAVICEYLEDAYQDAPLRPTDPLQRATTRQWTVKPDAGLHRACGIISFAIAFRHQMLKLSTAEVERRMQKNPIRRCAIRCVKPSNWAYTRRKSHLY